MRTMLRISILLNCVLSGCLVFLLLNGRRARNQVEAPIPEVVMPAPVASPTAEMRPFHWSQIESVDYRIYVANLRAIGCPEQTIRDIITADVDSLHAARRQPLEAKLAASTFVGGPVADAELRELRDQEASAITALLASPPAAANMTSAPSALAAETRAPGSDRQEPRNTALAFQAIQNSDPPSRELGVTASDVAPGFPSSRSVRQTPPAMIALPLVFHEVDPSVLTLNPQQAQVVNDLRQKFIEQVGGPNQDPNDPAYSQRWQTNQPAVDLDLWSMLGINAFQTYQIAAWAKAHEPTPPGP